MHWTGQQITLLSLSFIFDSHNFIIPQSLPFSVTIPNLLSPVFLFHGSLSPYPFMCDISGALIVNGWRQKWIDKKKEKNTWRGIVCENEKIEVW